MPSVLLRAENKDDGGVGKSIYTWLHSILVRHNSISCSESAHVVYGRFLYSF